jgi:YVTN family beta-propeller protein
MSKSYRVRTQVGVDKSVTVNLDQDFDFLEILSLKLSQSEIYVRQCSDYGVIAGRVSVNDGYGVPNAKLSLFIPITADDELNPTISEIYPYKTISDINEDGYKYNLLPYKPSFPGHAATGSFPDLEDVLTNPTAIELYDKYYKFTVTTNDSGDFMIFGVPVGSYTILMNLDLSDMGPFSQSPQDLIRIGVATESQVNGTKFQTSENLTTLPQIIFLNKTVEVLPLWGEPEICQPSITRTDFDLTAEASITIKPTAIFMGSIISDTDESALRKNCKPIKKSGYQCNLISGPGQILAIRQTIKQDINGRPILEEYEFENNGKVIDSDGAWLLDVPMNLDFIITNEFGEQIFSNDERKGIPTKSKYRFKVKWNQSPSLGEPIKRANFLIPNVKENGWDSNNPDDDPLINFASTSGGYIAAKKSYAFSLDWDDYGYSGSSFGDDIIQEAINCEDKFYEMSYNKVYTISQLVTRFTKGNRQRQYLGIKNITDETCESTSNKFPTNDAQYRFDLLFLLFVIVSSFISIILKLVVTIFHVICFLVSKIRNFGIGYSGSLLSFTLRPFENWQVLIDIENRFSQLAIPLFVFPECQLCSCTPTNEGFNNPGSTYRPPLFTNSSILANIIDPGSYDVNTDYDEVIGPIQRFAAGWISNNLQYSAAFRTPQRDNFSDGRFIWVQGLTIPESVNMMNFKGKFFGEGNAEINTTGDLNKRTDTRSITVGTNPIFGTYAPNGRLYVGNNGSSNVSAIDTANNGGVSTISVGSNPTFGTYVNNTLYVGFGGANGQVKPINTTNNVASGSIILFGNNPSFGTYNPVNQYLYVGNNASDTVTIINTVNNGIAGIKNVGDQPIFGTYNPSNNCVYVGNKGDGTVSVISGTSSTIPTISVGNNPSFGTYTPNNNCLYVGNRGDGTISVISGVTVIDLITIGPGTNPTFGTYNPDNGYLYVGNSGSGDVSVFDTINNNSLITIISIGPGTNPSFGTYVSGENRLYVGNTLSNTVSVIDTSINSVINTISVGSTPSFAVYNTTNDYLYVGNSNNSVRVIDTVNGSDYCLGGGTNQIRVRFNEGFNGGTHYDNIMMLMLEEKIESGTILTFNNPYDGVDVNMSATTQANAYGTYSVTGNPINVSGTTTVSYTDPITGGRKVTNYNITQTNSDTDRYLKYPTGIEYFQVITAMTFDEYSNILVSSGWLQDKREQESFFARIFNNWTPINQSIGTNGPDIRANTNSPGLWSWINLWSLYSDKPNALITIMVRGVDPHSSRIPIKYGLGRLFGRTTHFDVSVIGDFKMNIPLQPNDGLDFGQSLQIGSDVIAYNNAHRCVNHTNIINNTSVDTGYSNGRLFFPSYHFQPDQWTPFPTYRSSNYSSLDENSNVVGYAPGGTPPAMYSSIAEYTFIGGTNGTTGGGLRVGGKNMYARLPGSQIDGPSDSGYCGFPVNYVAPTVPPAPPANVEIMQFVGKRYAIGESVEGGSMVGMRSEINTLNNGTRTALGSVYFSPKYLPTVNTIMSDSNRIVMRTDRMPTSDLFQSFNTVNTIIPQGMNMMANGQFTVYQLSDEGVVAGVNPASGTQAFPGDDPDIRITGSTEPESFGSVDKVLDSFACEHLVPIGCYQNVNDTLDILPAASCQFYTSGGYAQFFIGGSCYNLVHANYLGAHLTKDLQLVTEWLSRMNINFGACREVFSHTFFNNWVNGSLYMFPFKTTRYFTGPNGNPPNIPYNKYCKDTIYLDPDTSNFYYRSSPYDEATDDFVGKKGFYDGSNLLGNSRNLMFPTTMMDLGPRDELQKFLSQSGNWDGYIMNKLNSTTFGDTSEILNIFILSRFASTSFGALFGTPAGASIMNYFSRPKRFVDADFSQMIATNSQLGISAFEPANYPEPAINSGFNSPLYFPGGVGSYKDITFGIFYTGDSQLRDYISPNRTLYNPDGLIGINNDCNFTYIPVTTQTVPFYLWQIFNNSGNDNIFGKQTNDWVFGGAGANAFKYGYQKIDRLYGGVNGSRTFQPSPSVTEIKYNKGWIYNVDGPLVINPATGESDYKPEPGISGKYNLGAPFYFYFGLAKGASAFDRFTAKWIDTDAFAD